MQKKKLFWLLIFAAIATCVGITFHYAQRWRGASPSRTHFIGHAGWDLTVLDDGWLLAASEKEITGWDTRSSPQKRLAIETRVPIHSVTAGDEDRFYVVDQDGGLLAFNNLGDPVAAGPDKLIEAVSFHDGRLLASDQSGNMHWLDPETLAIAKTQPLPVPMDVIDHVGEIVCSGAYSEALIRVFEGTDTWTVPISRVGAIAISDDTKWIGVVTWRGELYLVDRTNRKIAWRREVAWTGQMKAVRFAPNSQLILTCSPIVGRVWVFDCASGESVLESSVGGDPIDVDFVNSDEIVALHADGDVRWWSLER